MKNIIVLLVVLLSKNKLLLAQNENAGSKKFAKTITEKDLKKHLYYIAGPECEGRGTGTPGIAKAAAYIENEFKKNGLLPGNGNSYQMSYMLMQDSIGESSLVINGKSYAYNEYFSGNNRNNTNQKLTATQLIYVGYGIQDTKLDEYKGLDVKGKIVVVEEGEPTNADSTYVITGNKKTSEWSRNATDKKADIAAKNGAVAIFIIPKKYQKSNIALRRGPQYPVFRLTKTGINRYFINNSLVSILFNEDKPTIGKTVTQDLEINFSKIQFETPSTNVIGIIPGTDKKDEYVFVTAHMDHLGKRDTVIYYGADDDGSGTCAVMEMAQAFGEAAKNKKTAPRRTMVFMTVSGEERGLWGSAYYAQNPIFDLAKTSVDLNIDMIGRVGSDYLKDAPDSLNYVYVIGDDKLSTDLRPINEAANENTKLKLDYRYNDPNDPNRFYYRSDHYNFAEKGVPIIFYFDGVHSDYHRPTDTPDKINYDLYANRARLVFYTAWTMANRDGMVKRDIPLK